MTIFHLEQEGKPELTYGLLQQAIAFFNAGSRCAADIYITPTLGNSAIGPSVVCYAFSIELYLKLLCAITTGQAARGHKLTELFDRLPEATRTELSAVFPGINLREELEKCSNAFVEWRYSHEQESLVINPSFFIVVARACHQMVRKLKPSLEVLGENSVA
jgi:hypothetical protein